MRVCPICGCGLLEVNADAKITVRQNEEGRWIPVLDQDTLDEACTDPYVHVRCMNSCCGPTYDSHGNEVQPHPQYGLMGTFLMFNDMDPSTPQEEIPEEIISAEMEWEQNFTHVPWEGTIGETIETDNGISWENLSPEEKRITKDFLDSLAE